MAEKALTAVIQGASTCSVDDLVKAMGMSGISKSQVSRLCEEIDDKVKAFPEPSHRRSGSRRRRKPSPNSSPITASKQG